MHCTEGTRLQVHCLYTAFVCGSPRHVSPPPCLQVQHNSRWVSHAAHHARVEGASHPCNVPRKQQLTAIDSDASTCDITAAAAALLPCAPPAKLPTPRANFPSASTYYRALSRCCNMSTPGSCTCKPLLIAPAYCSTCGSTYAHAFGSCT